MRNSISPISNDTTPRIPGVVSNIKRKRTIEDVTIGISIAGIAGSSVIIGVVSGIDNVPILLPATAAVLVAVVVASYLAEKLCTSPRWYLFGFYYGEADAAAARRQGGSK